MKAFKCHCFLPLSKFSFQFLNVYLRNFHAMKHLLLVYQLYMNKTQHCLICFLQLALCLLHIKAPPYDKQYDIKNNVNEGSNISVIIFTPKNLLRRHFPEHLQKISGCWLLLLFYLTRSFWSLLIAFLLFWTFLCTASTAILGFFLTQAFFTLYSFTTFCCICDSDESRSTLLGSS